MTQTRPYQGYPYANPTVIDVPSVPASITASRPPRTRPNQTNQSTFNKQTEQKQDSVVENTIFYDPFENKTINYPKPDNDDPPEETIDNKTRYHIENENATIDYSSSDSEEDNEHPRFNPRPGNLGYGEFTSGPTNDLSSSNIRDKQANVYMTSSSQDVGSSSGATSSFSKPSLAESQWKKETAVFGVAAPDDQFPLSPIPVSEFPEPPPAYTEFDKQSVKTVEPPRTQVIVPQQATSVTAGIIDPDRMYMTCPLCRQQVHTIIRREAGTATNILAVILLLMCFLPCLALVFYTDACKYKNHYCPGCDRLLAYEVPMLGQEVVYTTAPNL